MKVFSVEVIEIIDLSDSCFHCLLRRVSSFKTAIHRSVKHLLNNSLEILIENFINIVGKSEKPGKGSKFYVLWSP